MTGEIPELSVHWPGLQLTERAVDGARSEVWLGAIGDQRVVARRSRRSAASLDWEIELLAHLAIHEIRVPRFLPERNGSMRCGPWTVQTFLDGAPPDPRTDDHRVRDAIQAVHRVPVMMRQRPGSCSVTDLGRERRSVDADLDAVPREVLERCLTQFEPFADDERTFIHGDAHPENIRIDAAGRVGFIDWDEARIDIPALDLSAVAPDVLPEARRRSAANAAHAWETLNGWVSEPAYARRRYAELSGS